MAKIWPDSDQRMIGKIIFANLLELPIWKYFMFAREVKRQPLLEQWIEKGWVWENNLSGLRPLLRAPTRKDTMIGEYAEEGHNEYGMRYFHPYFQHHYGMHKDLWSRFLDGTVEKRLLHRLRRINSRNLLTHHLLSTIAEEQKDYLSTGDVHRLKPLTLLGVANRMRNDLNSDLGSRLPGEPPHGQGNPEFPFTVSHFAFRVPSSPICHTWLSRLIPNLHVMLPDGLVRPLKELVPSQRDQTKRALRELLNEESRKIMEGTLEAPYADSRLRELLRGRFCIATSRHTVTSVRLELGIPAARGRSQNFWHVLAAAFSGVYPLTAKDIALNVPQSCGIYELRLKDGGIAYPGGKSSIFYIGRSKNLRKRLIEHLQPRARNKTINCYVQDRLCGFRFLVVEELCRIQEEKRLYDLFVSTFGAPPKCNRVSPVRG